MAVDYQKLDAALLVELERGARDKPLLLFIHAAAVPAPAQLAELSALGVTAAMPQQRVFSAQASSDKIDALSELPWIHRLTLSRKLTPLDESSSVDPGSSS